MCGVYTCIRTHSGIKSRMDNDNFGEFICREFLPCLCSSMAGGKETRKLLPLALVHTQVSREVSV